MILELRTDVLQVDRVNIVDENDAMRIAHADASHLVLHAVNFDRLANEFLTAKARDGNQVRVKNRLAHVDRNQVVFHADG